MNYYIHKLFGLKVKLAKKPQTICLIDAYGNIPLRLIEKLQQKYAIETVSVLSKDHSSAYYTTKTSTISSLPDLIIYCSNKLEFALKHPEILSKAEIIFSRFQFSERLFFQGLQHYANCTINNGK